MSKELKTYDLEDTSRGYDCWREMVEDSDNNGDWCYTEDAKKIIEAANKKVERLEKAIWEYEHEEHSSSPELIQEYLDDIYTGKLDERFDKVIAECKKEWEG